MNSKYNIVDKFKKLADDLKCTLVDLESLQHWVYDMVSEKPVCTMLELMEEFPKERHEKIKYFITELMTEIALGEEYEHQRRERLKPMTFEDFKEKLLDLINQFENERLSRVRSIRIGDRVEDVEFQGIGHRSRVITLDINLKAWTKHAYPKKEEV